jgi:hypothetical protein
VTALDTVQTHRCTRTCRYGTHEQVVWLANDEAFRAFDRDLLARRVILSSARTIRRDAAGPRPADVPGWWRPWAVQWARKTASAS